MTDVSTQIEGVQAQPAADDNWTADWAAFMGHSFGDVPPDELPVGGESAPIEQNSQPAPTNGEPAPVENVQAGMQQAPQEAPVQPAAGEQQNAPVKPEGEELDAAALLAMATGETPPAPAPDTGAAPAAEPQAEPETFRPFIGPVQLPAQTIAALFEAEDTETRAAAIGGILQAMGNTIVQILEERQAKVHAPALQARVIQAYEQQQESRRLRDDFYGTFSYLNTPQYQPIVAKAFEITAKQHPTLTYEQARDKVGNLARQYIKRMTGIDPAPAQQQQGTAPPASAPAVSRPPAFVASGARPVGTGSPPDENSPEAVLDSMIASGF